MHQIRVLVALSLFLCTGNCLSHLCVQPPSWTFYDVVSRLEQNISASTTTTTTISSSSTNDNLNITKSSLKQLKQNQSLFRSPFETKDSKVTLVALNSFRGNRFQDSFFIENLQIIYEQLADVRMLKDIRFILVNSKNSFNPALIAQVRKQVTFEVYQELASSPIDTLLGGGNGDIFIYDRCALLAYYIPFPLSIIHSGDPFLQATILAAYTDSPCKSICRTSDNVSYPIVDTQANTTNDTIVSNATEVAQNATLNQESLPSNIKWTHLASNDTYQTIEEAKPANQTKSNELYLHMGEILQNFYDLFRKKGEENVNYTGNQANRVNDSSPITPTPVLANRTENELNFTSSTSNDTNSIPLKNPQLIVASTVLSHLEVSNIQVQPRPVSNCNRSICREWSTELLLKARLCCLNYPNADEKELLIELQAGNFTLETLDSWTQNGGGFGCQLFARARCNRILPILKCCTRKLVNDYFDYTIRLREQQQKQQMNYNEPNAQISNNSETIVPNYSGIEYLHQSVSSQLFDKQSTVHKRTHRKRLSNN